MKRSNVSCPGAKRKRHEKRNEKTCHEKIDQSPTEEKRIALESCMGEKNSQGLPGEPGTCLRDRRGRPGHFPAYKKGGG